MLHSAVFSALRDPCLPPPPSQVGFALPALSMHKITGPRIRKSYLLPPCFAFFSGLPPLTDSGLKIKRP